RHANEARPASRMCEEGQDSCRRSLQQDRKRQMVPELPEGRESVQRKDRNRVDVLRKKSRQL
ncbi:hypothetical protein BHM03_00060414, partial [Ensete ventricosum]